jgi:hypothetical protein
VVPVAELVWLTDRDEDRADNHFAGCDRASYQKVDAIIFPFRDFDGPGSKVRTWTHQAHRKVFNTYDGM